MLTQTSKNKNRRHVHERIRKKILGTAERPRLNVYRSLNHIYVQVIDDLRARLWFPPTPPKAKRASGVPAETWLRPRPWAKTSPSAPRPKESPKLCSIAAATFITDGSRPWPMPPAKPDCSSKSSEIEQELERSVLNAKAHTRNEIMPTVIKKLDADSYQLKDQVVAINRVTKVVKGGKNLSFAALVVVGDPSAGGRRLWLRESEGSSAGHPQGN